ncbi:MAG: hypothetical protein QXD48_02260 [Candidatus Aenigmatarchaeota archaeon]
MKRVIEKIANSLSEIRKFEDGDPKFHDERYKPIPLDNKNFHEILESKKNRKIAFVDGGNAEILSAPNFSINFIRIYFNVFDGVKKIKPQMQSRIEFYAIVKLVGNNELIYKTEIFPLGDYSEFLPEEKYLSFSLLDQTLREGIFIVDISKISNVIRRFAEWKIAKYVIKNELDCDDIIVKDGSLQTGVTNEHIFSEDVYDAAIRKNVIFSGLAKTSTLFTTTGNSLLAVLKKRGNAIMSNKKWYYYPIVDIEQPDHKAEIIVTKLHPNSNHVFRYEILKEQFKKIDVNDVIATLAENSCDFRFPGYPFGLIDADSLARVTENEKLYHRALLLSETKKQEDFISASDAHEILNKIFR